MTDRELMELAMKTLALFASDESPEGWLAIDAYERLRVRLEQEGLIE